LDGSLGSDDNLAWVLGRGYQLVAKGFSDKRAAAFARRVKQWTEVRADERWVAPSSIPLAFPVQMQTVVVHWHTQKGALRHALYITTNLKATPIEVVRSYGSRGAGEVDIQADH